jgi:hypothetical protein
METETPSPRRRPRTWLLVLLAIALVGLVAYWMWPTPVPAPPPQNAQRTRSARSGASTNDGISPDDLKVRLDALQAKQVDPSDSERNPFRFKPPPAPPAPKPVTALPTVPPPPTTPPPPVIPPIPLKFMGTVEGPGVKLAALTDCKGFTYSGREGETIDGRYRLVRIQTESIIIEYVNGTGRSTIRKSGECGAIK